MKGGPGGGRGSGGEYSKERERGCETGVARAEHNLLGPPFPLPYANNPVREREGGGGGGERVNRSEGEQLFLFLLSLVMLSSPGLLPSVKTPGRVSLWSLLYVAYSSVLKCWLPV
jgi:hypothetical protein